MNGIHAGSSKKIMNERGRGEMKDQANIKCSTQVLRVKTERHKPSPFGSTIRDKPLNQDPNRLEGECTTRDQLDRTTDGRGSQSQAGRPLTVCVEAKQLSPTSGGN